MAELGIAGTRGRAKTITTRPDRHGRKSVDLSKTTSRLIKVDTLLSKRSHLHRNQRGVALPGMHHGCLLEENSWPCDGENNGHRIVRKGIQSGQGSTRQGSSTKDHFPFRSRFTI
jgi:hypothetical protein